MAEEIGVGPSKPMRASCGAAKHALAYSKRFARRLAERKSVEALEAESHIVNQLRPDVLNLVHLIALGLGGTIGTGIFVLSGQASARYAGPSVIISFVVSGIAALLSALSYAEMASMLSTSGSAYTYVYVALGEYPAFIIGWTSTLLYQLAASVVAVRWSHYVVHLINTISNYNASRWIVEAPVAWDKSGSGFYVTGQIINLPSIAIVTFITIILFLGIRETSMVNLVLIIFKIIIFLIFISAGCVYVNPANYRPFFRPKQDSFDTYGVGGMLKASNIVFFAYVGLEIVSTVTKEAKKPSKNIPYATIISLLICILLYVGVCTVSVGLTAYTGLNELYPIDQVIKATPYGIWLLVLMDLGALAGFTSVGIALLLAQTRIFYAMARDGLLPQFFSRIHSSRKTPWVATLICGVLCIFFSSICAVDVLGSTASVGALITFFLVHISVIVMRYTHAYLPRDFRIPFGPFLIPVLGALSCILLLIFITRETGIRYGVWMGVGHIFYFSYGFWFSKVRQERIRQSRSSLNELMPQANSAIAVESEEQPEIPKSDSVTETQF